MLDGAEAPFLPAAAELYKKRRSTFGHEVPMTFCMPHGVPDAMLVSGHPFKIVQTPNLVVHLYEEFTKYRQTHTDGRQLPVDPNPTHCARPNVSAEPISATCSWAS